LNNKEVLSGSFYAYESSDCSTGEWVLYTQRCYNISGVSRDDIFFSSFSGDLITGINNVTTISMFYNQNCTAGVDGRYYSTGQCSAASAIVNLYGVYHKVLSLK